jgi:hypothetical protein
MIQTFGSRQLRDFDPDREEVDYGPGIIQFESEQQYIASAATEADGYDTTHIRTVSNSARQTRRDNAELELSEALASTTLLDSATADRHEAMVREQLRLQYPDGHAYEVATERRRAYLGYAKHRPLSTARTYETRQKTFKVSEILLLLFC